MLTNSTLRGHINSSKGIAMLRVLEKVYNNKLKFSFYIHTICVICAGVKMRSFTCNFNMAGLAVQCFPD